MDLLSSRDEKAVLIAGHRGNWGGSIVPNTIGAYEAALKLGADIIESDILMSKDGVFFAYHSGEEKGTFHIDRSLYDMTADEILGLSFYNSMYEKVDEKVNRMDDVLDHFKGRCFFNIDRGWKRGWTNTLTYLRNRKMDDQLILKCPPEKELMQAVEEIVPNMMYMGIIRTVEDYELVRSFKRLNTVAVEINYNTLDEPVASEAFLDKVHRDGLLAWANALKINSAKNLAGGLDDNVSIIHGPEYGWGKLIDKGYDIIQTDWPSLVVDYIKTKRS